MLAMMMVAGVLADSINLPGIVGAFLAGLAVNAAVHEKPEKKKLEFFGNSFFIPIFFIVTGFLIDPLAFFQGKLPIFPWLSGRPRASEWQVSRGKAMISDERSCECRDATWGNVSDHIVMRAAEV